MIYSVRSFTPGGTFVRAPPSFQIQNNVILVAGQSNAVGQVNTANLPSYLAGGGNSNLQIYIGSNTWATLNNSVNNNTLEAQDAQSWGPEAEFSWRFAQDFPGRNLYIIKYSIDSTDLVTDWNPGIGGNKYHNMMTNISAAMAALSVTPTPVISCLLWMQGEQDSFDSTKAAAYGTNLPNFLTHVQTDWQLGTFPVIVGRVSASSALTFSAQVRTAQAAVLPPDYWINTDSYPLQADNIHYTAAGQVSMGDDMYVKARSAGFGN